MLALRARGVGSLWTTVHLQEPYQERARELLGLPKDYTQAVFLPYGYYKGKDFKPPRVRRHPAHTLGELVTPLRSVIGKMTMEKN